MITADQLEEAVSALATNAGCSLGEVIVKLGFLTQDQSDGINGGRPSGTAPAELSTDGSESDLNAAIAQLEASVPTATQQSVDATSIDLSRGDVPEAPPSIPPKAASSGTAQASVSSTLASASGCKSMTDFLTYTRDAGASDLHISATITPFLRRFGRIEKLDIAAQSADDTERLLFELLSEEQKQMLREQFSLEFCIDRPGEGRYRCTVIKQRCGYDGIFHVVRNSVPSFEELNLPESLRMLTEYQQGLVLITGPGNSGKTTTLAALIDVINCARTDHIITVESPVEYVHTSKSCQVTQREVGHHTESFAVALRASLREDPDIIMVGELRDLETLSMAITASETGHLVLGTLHTTSAARTVSKILDGFPPEQQAQIRVMLSESLRGVISQQLVARKDGKGLALALEVMLVTAAIGSLLRDNKPEQIPSIIQTSRKMGMMLMDDSLLKLVDDEIIDGADAYQKAEKKQLFAQ